MIQRGKTTIFTDAKESNTVYDLKKIIEGITKKPPEDQRLFKDGEVLEDTKTLADSGLTSNKAKAQDPAPLGLTFRKEDSEEFEEQNIVPYSNPPELPDVMKQSDTSVANSTEQPVP